MNVTCPSCTTIYRVDPAKVPEAGVRARCKVCAAVFPVTRGAAAPVAAAPKAPEPPLAAAAPAPPPPAPRPPAPPPAPPPPAAAPAPERPAAPPPPRPAPPVPPMAPPVAPRPTMAPPAVPGAGGRPTAPRQFPPGAPAAPRSPMMPPPAVRPTIPNSGAPAAPFRPAAPQDQSSILTPPAAPGIRLPGEAPLAQPPASPAPPRPPAPPAAPARPVQAPGRPVNPFLSQDPGQKARRLARALISDLVVYYPDRRKEGMANGTLKTLFQEEITKSWEEYTEQVGKELAETTTHFTDALNEILAGGQKVF